MTLLLNTGHLNKPYPSSNVIIHTGMKKRIAAVLLFLSVWGISACTKDKIIVIPKENPNTKPVEPVKSLYDTIITYQINYILATQLPDGAFTDTKISGSRISPYFANIACRALLKVPTAANIAAVKKWMVWYMNKLNGNINPVTGNPEIAGSVYDYYGSAQTTNGTYDSVDSYAATFLSLAKDLAVISPSDKDWLAGYSSKLILIGDALEKCIDNQANTVPSTFGPDDNDGLSVDSYVHGAKYLMDNAEVNEGLKSMIWLQSNVLTNNNAAHYQVLSDANTSAIESQLWRGTMYNWNDNGSTGSTNSKWSVFYADATCQLYPGLFGVINPTSARANLLYSTFNSKYPNWSEGTVYDAGGYPWAVVCYAAAVINDKARVVSYLNHILSFNKAGSEKPKWYIGEAAFVILASERMKKQGNAPKFIPTTIPEIPIPTVTNLALGKKATSSGGGNTEGLSNDGDMGTRWFSAIADNQWWKTDLGSLQNISKIDIKWEGAYATDYAIQVSSDDVNFTTVFSTTTGAGGDVSHPFTSTDARYINLILNKRIEIQWAFSFWEFEVYK